MVKQLLRTKKMLPKLGEDLDSGVFQVSPTRKAKAAAEEAQKTARLDARMAELDKYLKDPTLKLGLGPTGKLQFHKITEQKGAVKDTPKTSTAASSASTSTKTVKGTGAKGGNPMNSSYRGKDINFTASRVGAGTIDMPDRIAKAEAAAKEEEAHRMEALKDIGSGLARGIAAGALALPIGRAIQGVRGLANMVRIARAKRKPPTRMPPRQRVQGQRVQATYKKAPEMEEQWPSMIDLGFYGGLKKGGKIKSGKVRTVMHEFKTGELKSSSGKKVTNPKQAVAIAMSEAGIKKRKYAEGGKIGNVDNVPKKSPKTEKQDKNGSVPGGEEAELNPFGKDTVRVLNKLKKERGFARGGEIELDATLNRMPIRNIRNNLVGAWKVGIPKISPKHGIAKRLMKRGGSVKASDGCARKGRTKGRIV